MSDVTRILSQIENGDPQAAKQLLPLVYDELRKLAAARLAQHRPGHNLEATELVHEAYLRLVEPVGNALRGVPPESVGNALCGVPPAAPQGDSAREGEAPAEPISDLRPLTPDPRSPTPAFSSRGHFFAAAAEAMRRILVDHARANSSLKRGGGRKRLDLDQIDLAKTPVGEELLAFNEALTALQSADPAAGQLVQLRYFAGLSVEEAAQAMGIPRSTAYDHWTFARAWLRCRLRDENA